MEFLVQYAIEGSEKIINKIVNSCWIIKATNESDFNGIEEMHVFDVTDLGKIKPLHYRGWQPGCLIEYVERKHKSFFGTVTEVTEYTNEICVEVKFPATPNGCAMEWSYNANELSLAKELKDMTIEELSNKFNIHIFAEYL